MLACDAKEPDDGAVADAGDDEDEDDAQDDVEDEEPVDEPVDEPPPQPTPPASELCDPEAWAGEACTTPEGAAGTTWCIIVDGAPLQTPCSAAAECEPGDSWDMGCMGTICFWNGETFEEYSWSEPDCVTPLVVELDGPTTFAPATASAFDMSTDGSCQSTDWPSSPWLALDRDGDGIISSGAELFGSATKMSTGGHAEHGFAALAELDDDNDGRITAADRAFADLVLWSDLDADRRGVSAELRPLASANLVAIDLGFARRTSCDAHGNCGRERASFEYRTASGGVAFGDVVDVYLECR